MPNINFIEQMWEGCRQEELPLVGDDFTKIAKICFLQGVHIGQQASISATQLSDDDCHRVMRELRDQTRAALAQLMRKPCQVSVGTIKTDNQI